MRPTAAVLGVRQRRCFKRGVGYATGLGERGDQLLQCSSLYNWHVSEPGLPSLPQWPVSVGGMRAGSGWW